MYLVSRPAQEFVAASRESGYEFGKSDVKKGYKVYLQKDNVVVVTQHVANIETLIQEQNLMLQSSMEESGCDERIHSEGADDRDLTITAEEEATIPCSKANLPSEVAVEAPQAHVKLKKEEKVWSRPRPRHAIRDKQSDVSSE